jgi:hypothetical protein
MDGAGGTHRRWRDDAGQFQRRSRSIHRVTASWPVGGTCQIPPQRMSVPLATVWAVLILPVTGVAAAHTLPWQLCLAGLSLVVGICLIVSARRGAENEPTVSADRADEPAQSSDRASARP